MCMSHCQKFSQRKNVNNLTLSLLNQNESATEQVLNKGGWLNTGDIGWIAPYHSTGRSRRCGGIIVLEGRAKDTIVLSTGNKLNSCALSYTRL